MKTKDIALMGAAAVLLLAIRKKRAAGKVAGIKSLGPSSDYQYYIRGGYLPLSKMTKEFLKRVNETLSDNGYTRKVTLAEVKNTARTMEAPSTEFSARWAYDTALYSPYHIAKKIISDDKDFDTHQLRTRGDDWEQTVREHSYSVSRIVPFSSPQKELNPEKYTTSVKNMQSRTALGGVHYEGGYRIATNPYVLLMEPWNYPEEMEGKTQFSKAKDRWLKKYEVEESCTQRYPRLESVKKVIPTDLEDVQSDMTIPFAILKNDDSPEKPGDLTVLMGYKEGYTIRTICLPLIKDFITAHPEARMYVVDQNHPVAFKDDQGNLLLVTPAIKE